MGDKVVLSVVIPTYNGAKWIEDTLESVLVQMNRYKESVEVLVRDNASTDNTEQVVEQINQKYDNIIIYNKRNTNVIADVNFREAVTIASGEYVLMLGDDDLLMPGYIEQTLDCIEKYANVGLIYHNRISTTRDYQGASAPKHKNPNKTFKHFYENVEDFIKDYPSGPDFMSVNVVRRDCIIKGFSFAKEEYYGVEWYASMLKGLEGYTCISLFNPLILQRAPLKRTWDDKALLYVIVGMNNMFRDLSVIYPTIYEVWLSYQNANISKLWYLTKCIPLNKELYKEKYNELSKYLSKYEKFVAKSLIIFPSSYYVYRFLYLVNKIVKILKINIR